MVTFGVATFSTDYSVRPDEFAKAAEERGFGSVFFPEHTHIPTSRKTPFPMGGELPKDYSHLHDLFIAMTAAAMATTRIKIGAGVCLITEHDPIHLAKQVASLDALSNGRVILGIGAGWNAEEMEDHGVSFKKRWRVTGERVKAIKRIWREDTAEFHGEFVNFDPIWCWPKPVQAGGPPVWIPFAQIPRARGGVLRRVDARRGAGRSVATQAAGTARSGKSRGAQIRGNRIGDRCVHAEG
jgi:probable F420-dependent oxidoreductase